MRTLKTAFVVMGLIAVLYGAYVVINKPQSLPSSISALLGVGKEKPAEGNPAEVQITQPDDAVRQAGHAVPDLTGNLPAPSPPGSTPINWPAPNVVAANRGNPAGINPAQPLPLPPGQPPVVPAEQLPVPPGGGYYGDPREVNTQIIRVAQPEATPPPADPRRSPALVVAAFQQAWQTAEEQLSRGQLGDALRTLTPFYNNQELHADDRTKLVDLLDRLAGTVIYSKQHHFLEKPYKVRPNERLTEIAEQYKLPWELLAQINSVNDPNILFPGEELKVLPGPFQAIVNLESKEVVLLVGGCYAGRIPISVGSEVPRLDQYNVVRRLRPGEPGNTAPGSFVIDLGGGMTIYGDTGTGSARGAIAVSPRDATDLYCILTERKSGVTIRR